MGSCLSSNLSPPESVPTDSCDVRLKLNELVMNSDRFCACSIAITNETKHELLRPKKHFSVGKTRLILADIKSGYTGFMLGETRRGKRDGLCGIITYEVKLADGKKELQILLYMPSDLPRNSCSCNIRMGHDSDDREFFFKARTGYDSRYELVEINHTFCLDDQFEAEAFMTNNDKSTLLIKFRERI